jgi:hypothetical protein
MRETGTMSIRQAVKITFLPALGTAVFLVLVGSMALIQFLVVEPEVPSRATRYTLGYIATALSLKSILGAVFGLFVGRENQTFPRGAMLFLATVFALAGTFLLLPLLLDHAG